MTGSVIAALISVGGTTAETRGSASQRAHRCQGYTGFWERPSVIHEGSRPQAAICGLGRCRSGRTGRRRQPSALTLLVMKMTARAIACWNRLNPYYAGPHVLGEVLQLFDSPCTVT